MFKIAPPLPQDLRSEILILSSRMQFTDIIFVLEQEEGLIIRSVNRADKHWLPETMRKHVAAAACVVLLGDTAWETLLPAVDGFSVDSFVRVGSVNVPMVSIPDAMFTAVKARKFANLVVYSIAKALSRAGKLELKAV